MVEEEDKTGAARVGSVDVVLPAGALLVTGAARVAAVEEVETPAAGEARVGAVEGPEVTGAARVGAVEGPEVEGAARVGAVEAALVVGARRVGAVDAVEDVVVGIVVLVVVEVADTA